MGWAEEFLARQRGQQKAQQAGAPIESFTGGLISSVASGFAETFGVEPFEAAERFQEEHPIIGGGAALTGALVPYLAAGAASTTVRGARLLEGAMARVPGVRALSATEAPISYGIAREAIRYSPVEIARLGIGLGTTDTWSDYGNLLADVGLSTLITGGFGGIGGFFRAGGKRLPEIGRVVDADLAFKPTFEYRMSKAPGAQVTGDLPLEDVQNHLFKQIWTEKPFEAKLPGQSVKYVDQLEGGNPETDSLVNQLFKPSGDKASKASLNRQPLMKKDGTWALDDTQRTEMLGGLGFGSMEDLAERVVYPRLITVNSDRAAGTISKALDDSAMQWVAPGVMMGKEAQGGLYVIAKRLDAGGGALRDRMGRFRGSKDIKAGDRWFIAKTDQPQAFAPEGYKFAQLTVNQWAKYREAWKPSGAADLFNRDSDLLLQAFSPRDYKDIATRGKAALGDITERATARFAELTDLKSSATVRQLVDQFYDVVAPQVVKEGRDALYARLYGLLRNSARVADRRVNQIVGGRVKVIGSPLFRRNIQHSEGFMGNRTVQEIANSLSPEERVLLKRISDAQAPMDALEKYTADGLVSNALRTAVEDLQKINRSVWEHDLMPAFKNAELPGQFDLLEGYIMPRIFKGDWFVPVENEAGHRMWLSSGSLAGAKKEAQAVVDEANKKGLTLKLGQPYSIGQHKTVDEVQNIHNLVQMQIGQSREMQEIVQNAMKRIAIERAGVKRGAVVPNLKPPKTLTTERSGLRGSPDWVEEVTPQDIIKGVESHYRQLYRFAGYSTWKRRFYPEAMNLDKLRPALAEDLRRKANQLMGYEGQITNTLNKALAPIFGHHLGGKAATRIAQSTNELMYNWNLAIANPTFALLNVLSPIQTTMPHIAFLLRAPVELAERDMHMSLRYGPDGLPREVVGVMHPAKVMRQAWREMGKPDAELLESFGRAKTDGTLLAQLFEGFVGGQSRAHETLTDAFKNAGGGVAGGWEFIKRTATFMAERSEEWARIQAFTAYHVLGRDYFKLSGDALYRFAQRGTHNSMFGYSVVDRSRMFTGPIGSMFGLFKNWQMHFISSMAQYAGLGWNHGIWSPMLWQFGVAGAIGGLGAMGPLKWVANGLASWADGEGGGKTSFLWMQENWHDAADEIYFGLPAVFGATLQASAALPGTDVRNDLTSLSSFVFIERAKAAGKAVGAAWDYSESAGQNPLRDPNTRDKLLQAFAPRAFFRAFAAVEGDYIKSMTTGYPQVREVGPLSKFLHGMGLNQVEVEQQQVAARELWKDQETRRQHIQNLGVRLADAQLNGDFEEMERVNRRAVALGIEPSKVYKSATTRLRREQEGDVLSRYDADLVARYSQVFTE